MKGLMALVAGALVISVGAAAAHSSSGLYGKAVISPAYPVCQEGVSCSKPARNFRLRFYRGTRHVADARTNAYGKFRIALAPGTYRVGAASTKLTYPSIRPRTAIVPLGRYARLSFVIDIGIR